MTKILEIEDCSMCGYMDRTTDPPNCLCKSPPNDEVDYVGIPAWCPLPDKEQVK